ncbi:unnamed protein product [Gordionus sp. m RMFG-2023]|uniref:vesicle transport through interaction with t-SNAREs homolog 1A-like isoform X3 n=1 Tax=Gordionus sp. m RMFG-2023 TaxID=3053472 RepID=UPI0030DFFF81
MLSANIIQSHIKNFENLLQVIKERVNRSALVNERYVNLPEVSKLLEEGHELLEQIDLESNDLPMNEKQHIKYLSDQYKTQLDGLDKTYKELKISQKSNDYLEGDNCKDEEKQSLLANLDRCTDNIDHGYRVALESEKIGAEILTDLKWQRESLERSHDRLREMSSDLGKSSRILSGMIRRILQNRFIVAGVIILMIIVIIITFWYAKKK